MLPVALYQYLPALIPLWAVSWHVLVDITYFVATTIVTEPCRKSSCLLPLCRHRINCFGRRLLLLQETGSYAEFSRLLQHTADGNVFKKVCTPA